MNGGSEHVLRPRPLQIKTQRPCGFGVIFVLGWWGTQAMLPTYTCSINGTAQGSATSACSGPLGLASMEYGFDHLGSASRKDLFQFQNGPREDRGFDGAGERKRWNGDFTTVTGGALRSGGGTICRIDPAPVRFQANRKCFNTPNVLAHSSENRETVECISQFAMLLGVCNRQSP